MNPKQVMKTISILLAILAGFMIIPALISVYYDEGIGIMAFAMPVLSMFAIAALFLTLFANEKNDTLSTRDGFLFVTLSWIMASLFGAMPFYLSGVIPSFADAFFETISGFSTTGASILTNVEALPRSLLFWRSLTHWLGGMGIVVLTVAVLPLLGIGGLQLVKAEAPGPTVDKLTPRITETSKILWYIYTGLTIAQTALLMLGGMSLFDALTHTFGTLATGGFSTKNGSVGHYNSAYIDWVVTVFMILAGVSFSLHYRFMRGGVKHLIRDTEFKAYIAIFLGATAIIAFNLRAEVYGSLADSFRYAAFQAASILTTTGFATADFERWPFLSQFILFALMFVGGCSGSTGGGIKVIRIVTLFKQGLNEMKYLIHSKGVFILKISGMAVKKDTVYAILGFFFLYIFMILLVAGVVAASGQDISTSLTASLATVGNIGPGFGNVGPVDNYAFFPAYIKWTLSFAMLVGRLELYTVLVILTPVFWRK